MKKDSIYKKRLFHVAIWIAMISIVVFEGLQAITKESKAISLTYTVLVAGIILIACKMFFVATDCYKSHYLKTEKKRIDYKEEVIGEYEVEHYNRIVKTTNIKQGVLQSVDYVILIKGNENEDKLNEHEVTVIETNVPITTLKVIRESYKRKGEEIDGIRYELIIPSISDIVQLSKEQENSIKRMSTQE